MLRKIVKFILIVILAWVLLIGGIAAAGYATIKSKNSAGKLASTVGGVLNKDINLSEEVASLSIYEYSKTLIGMVGNISSTRIGDLENYIGMNTLSGSLEDAVGVPAETTKSSTIGDLPSTITSSVTLATAVDKFGIDLPSMPIFSEDEFMNKTLSTAFGNLNEYSLDSFITVVYSEDATPEHPASPMIMQKFGKYSLKQIASDSKAIIGGFSLGDLLTITESSPKILQTLQNNTVETQYDADGNVLVKSIQDAIRTTPLKELAPVGTSYIWQTLGEYTLDGLSKAMDELTIGQITKITETSHPLLKAIANTKATKLATAIPNAIYGLTFDELIDVSSMRSPAPILVALKDTKISDVSTKLNNLTLAEVYGNAGSGILALVPAETKLSDMPAVLLANTMNEDVYTLSTLGIISLDLTSSSTATKAYILNSTVSDILADFPAILDGTKSILSLAPASINYSSAILDEATLESLEDSEAFTSGMTIKLQQDTAIPAGEIFDMAFNIDTNGYVLTIGEGAEFNIDGGYAYFKGDMVGSIGSTQTIAISSAETAPAFLVEYTL